MELYEVAAAKRDEWTSRRPGLLAAMEADAAPAKARTATRSARYVEVRSTLKGAGFRWAPSLGCWQAYRNHRSQEIARSVAGVQ